MARELSTGEVAASVADGVALVTLNRPERMNALDGAAIEKLQEILDDVGSAQDVGALVIAGEGRMFCAGADLAHLDGLASLPAYELYLASIQRVVLALHELDRPVICAVHGGAYGAGFELMLASDLRLVDRDASLALSEVKVGLVPAAGGTRLLTEALPRPLAAKMLLLGERITGERAVELGLANEAVAAEQLHATAFEWGRELARGSQPAIRASKTLMRSAVEGDLSAALANERRMSTLLFEGADAREGLAAFREKREPSFVSRVR